MGLKFNIPLESNCFLQDQEKISFSVEGKTLDDKVRLMILRDLWQLNWQINFKNNKIEISPPKDYNKDTIKHAMSHKRYENIIKNQAWIDKNLELARQNLANGHEVLQSKIDPVIEVCETEKQHQLFRILRYYWSSPYSDYVGRRIKLIIRDKALPNKPVIGIAALGSPIIHIPERDKFIGWNTKTRTKNLIYTMDAYVIGALPPYNHLLGGKLISYILASKEVKNIYRKKYKDQITIIDKRVANHLAGIFTTSLYGKSSQYNRIKYNNELLYQPIGETKGFGTLHLSEETIGAMQEFLKSKKIAVTNNFGDGPSWTMRVIRTTGDLLGFDSDFLLKHSFKRSIYFTPLIKNYKNFLNDMDKKPDYYDYSLKELTNYWKERWLAQRKQNLVIRKKVLAFKKEDFNI